MIHDTEGTGLATAAVRGCGSRSQSGLYIEVGLGPGGRPIEHFLFDPPILVRDDRTFPTPMQGMALTMTPDGVWHLIDRIGTGYYPYASDFIEEGRRLGISRRVQKNLKITVKGEVRNGFDLLTKDSRLFLAHDRAYLSNWQDVELPGNPVGDDSLWHCPIDNQAHYKTLSEGPCASFYWQTHEPGFPPDGHTFDGANENSGWRHMPGFDYRVDFNYGQIKPEWGGSALIAAFPITCLTIIHGPETKQLLEATSGCQLPVLVRDF